MTSDFAPELAKYLQTPKNPKSPKMGISITKQDRHEISSP